MEYFKFDKAKHKIESDNILCDVETGRVVATFYNDYDLDDVLHQLDHNTKLYEKCDSLINENTNLKNKMTVLKQQLKYLISIDT